MGASSITVNIANNTEQGYITFNNLTFLDNSGEDFSPIGVSPYVSYSIKDNNSNTLALYACSEDNLNGTVNVYTQGEAVFNLPNGDTLTISWYLQSVNTGYNKVPLLKPSSASYWYKGLTNPSDKEGQQSYTFNVIIQDLPFAAEA
jgi:hypothetical protein